METQNEDKAPLNEEKLNKSLLFILPTCLIAIKLFFDQGMHFLPFPYRHYFFENVVFIISGLIIILSLLYLYLSYKSKQKKQKTKIAESLMRDTDEDESISNEEWGVTQHDMSKYKDWED